MPLRFAVIGNPIEHSRSPQLHQQFAQSLAIELLYDKVTVTEQTFESFVRDFFNDGGCGLNVTAPLKHLAHEIADEVLPGAAQSQTANTLWMKDNKLIADNTDGAGLLLDCKRLAIELQQKKILILGAGKVVRSIIPSLLSQQPEVIYLWARDLNKAAELCYHPIIQCVSKLQEIRADVIIQATSAAYFGELPAIFTSINYNNSICYDLNYGAAALPFLQLVQANAKQAYDGHGMLVAQAAKSFEHWHGVLPQLKHFQ